MIDYYYNAETSMFEVLAFGKITAYEQEADAKKYADDCNNWCFEEPLMDFN